MLVEVPVFRVALLGASVPAHQRPFSTTPPFSVVRVATQLRFFPRRVVVALTSAGWLDFTDLAHQSGMPVISPP